MSDFYWPIQRDYVFSKEAIDVFFVIYGYKGKKANEVKSQIDSDILTMQEKTASSRNGGEFATRIHAYEEAGLAFVDSDGAIQITEAGEQAYLLLQKAPGFLQTIPYFVAELLSRFKFNNPQVLTYTRGNRKTVIESTDVFPYYTLYYIMRKCEGFVTSEEMRRFVLRLRDSEEIDDTVLQIIQFREDKQNGMPDEGLNSKYPARVSDGKDSVRYVMSRAGRLLGNTPSLIEKRDMGYVLNEHYLPFVDQILANPETFADELDSDTWMRQYGRYVPLVPEFAMPAEVLPQDDQLDDTDEILIKIQNVISQSRINNFLFSGPPGTSKSWYAHKIGAKLAGFEAHRFFNIQFHPSYGYEDFMEGFVPSENQGFKLVPKVFLNACRAASNDPQKLYILVIDELNRGDPSRIFGEAFTYLEKRDERFTLSSGTDAVVPSNLILIATINPFDKSIMDLDMAMYRRFHEIEMLPDRELLKAILTHNNVQNPLQGRLIAFFDKISSKTDSKIGHAYFARVYDEISLKSIWEGEILPAIKREGVPSSGIEELVSQYEKLNEDATA